MPHLLYARADMWALLGVWAVQQTIDNSNDQCEDCGSVHDARVSYTYGRQVGFCLCGVSNVMIVAILRIVPLHPIQPEK